MERGREGKRGERNVRGKVIQEVELSACTKNNLGTRLTPFLGKRRFQYEELLQEDNSNYDIWFDYIRLEEAGGNQPKIREIYERAIATENMPPIMEKQYWKRYIYIWINYAIYEELEAKVWPEKQG
jgi:hypothetical protein